MGASDGEAITTLPTAFVILVGGGGDMPGIKAEFVMTQVFQFDLQVKPLEISDFV